MVKMYHKGVTADVKVYNLPTNLCKLPVESKRSKHFVETFGGLTFDKDASYYDMSGDKYLIILNQYKFEKTEYFKHQPSKRFGTPNDEKRLKEEFYKLGFKIFVFRDLKYENIIKYVSSIASLDHTNTSCVCVAILTHGDKGDEIYAADRPYLLSEVVAFFENEISLTNKPKLFFVQACRGGSMDAGHTVAFTRPNNCVVKTSPTFRRNSSFVEAMPMLQTGHTDAQYFGCCCGLLKANGIFSMGAGRSDAVNCQSDSHLIVPTHADTLVLRSTVEDYLSYRDEDGSWMIQTLCDIIENHHEDHHLLDMIILMNRTVAYDKITRYCKWKPMENKKQMPETRFTLTKQLKFVAVL